jgi:hypothetical protein
MDKFCNKCLTVKSLTEFHNNKSSKDGKAQYCKTCCNKLAEKYKKPKKERALIDYSNITEKHCNKCNTTKSIENFGKRSGTLDGLQYQCKNCCEIQHKLWRDNNKEKKYKWNKEWQEKNPERAKKSNATWRKKNPDKVKENRKKYYEKNPEKLKQGIEKLKEWQEKNTERAKKSNATWRKKNQTRVNSSESAKKSRERYKERNKEKIQKYQNEYMVERRKDDILFKLASNMRTRLYYFYKNSGLKKSQKTDDIIGCSWEELCEHIKSQFVEGMSYENYGKWHIDHIVPLASAKNEEDLKKLCNYKNLQPLWAEDNLKKNDKIL